MTRACSSLLTFRRKTKSHLFHQSYDWLRALHWDRQQMSALSCAAVLDINFVKCPATVWWQHSDYNPDIFSTVTIIIIIIIIFITSAALSKIRRAAGTCHSVLTKRCAFRRRAKVAVDSVDRRSSAGKLFQVSGPETAKFLRPMALAVRCTSSFPKYYRSSSTVTVYKIREKWTN